MAIRQMCTEDPGDSVVDLVEEPWHLRAPGCQWVAIRQDPGHQQSHRPERLQVPGEKGLAGAVVQGIAPLLRFQTPPVRRSRRSRNRSCVFKPADVEEFTTLTVCPFVDIWPYIETALESGAPVDAIFDELFAPAARRLGDLWDADDCDSLSVATGAHRLQTAARRLSQALGADSDGSASALLLPAPGETHVLGLEIVRARFERQGWSTDSADCDELDAAVRRRWFDLVAFSISYDRLADALGDAVARVRKVSRNRGVFLLVGGPVIASNPGLAARIGADAGAATPQEALVTTRSLLRRRPPT